MIATAIREKGQVTLPQKIRKAAELETGDQVEWHVKDGEIRGRKLVAATSEVLNSKDVDSKTLLPKGGKITQESIIRALRADRDERK